MRFDIVTMYTVYLIYKYAARFAERRRRRRREGRGKPKTDVYAIQTIDNNIICVYNKTLTCMRERT